MGDYVILKELKDGKKTLKLNDKFILAGMPHEVRSSYLNNIENNSNAKVFEVLKIKNKVSFCKKHYGYSPRRKSNFPESKECDFEALTRVAIALYEESLKVPFKGKNIWDFFKLKFFFE